MTLFTVLTGNLPQIHFLSLFLIVTQVEWKASLNQLHLSDRKEKMPLSASTVTKQTIIPTTTNPWPNDDVDATSASISQESVSVTAIQFPNNVSISKSNLSSDVESSRDSSSEESASDIIDSYLKNLSILPPLLPLIGTLPNNGSSSNLPTIPQQNLPLLQHSSSSSSSSSITNPKQQHQLSKTESAMLNYIYDQYAPNKHRHYDFR